MRALSCMFTVKERKLISNLAASKTWTIKDRCLACVSWLTSPFRMRRIGITLDSWLHHDSWTKSAVCICPEKETPPLVHDWSQVPRHSLTTVYMHLSSTLVYNIMSTDARTSGASEVWLGPKPRWLNAYQIFCEPSKHWACPKLGRAAFPMRFQTFPVQTVTNAKTDFSQRSGYSPSKLRNTCLWRRLPWPVCNSSPWAFPGAECNVSMFRQICWLYNERQKHLSVVWFMNEVMSSFCSWKNKILQFGLRLQV